MLELNYQILLVIIQVEDLKFKLATQRAEPHQRNKDTKAPSPRQAHRRSTVRTASAGPDVRKPTKENDNINIRSVLIFLTYNFLERQDYTLWSLGLINHSNHFYLFSSFPLHFPHLFQIKVNVIWGQHFSLSNLIILSKIYLKSSALYLKTGLC